MNDYETKSLYLDIYIEYTGCDQDICIAKLQEQITYKIRIYTHFFYSLSTIYFAILSNCILHT